ncbi:hypothetical protein RUM44_008020 [Polyplax serrata]|uniref:Uncharacterized protein n=1 Tax=Polyplax serrata TaxID=468196 RepID=A0ABR1B7J4_POLSC
MNACTFLLLMLLLVVEANIGARGECSVKKAEKCILCEKTPCECEKHMIDDNRKISIKRLILKVLGQSADKPDATLAGTCEECQRCRYTCPKRNKFVEVLRTLVNKSGCSKKNEEQALRDLIIKLIDPAHCEEHPCDSFCDPQVQKVLKAILKKVSGCNCGECPCDCMLSEKRTNHGDYPYWYKTTKPLLRREIDGKVDNRKNEDGTQLSDINDPVQVFKCKSKKKQNRPKNCHTCQRPDNLICPRYLTDDCPATSKDHSFSLCADCIQCKIATFPGDRKQFVALSCDDCKPVNSPFVEFTGTGCPFKRTARAAYKMQIRAKFLQIDDLRPETKVTPKDDGNVSIYNPFQPKCNRPRKRRKKYKRQ